MKLIFHFNQGVGNRTKVEGYMRFVKVSCANLESAESLLIILKFSVYVRMINSLVYAGIALTTNFYVAYVRGLW